MFVPSLICGNQLNLLDTINATGATGVSTLHLDVMDNHLVRGFGYSVDLIRQIRSHTDLKLDVHLMATNVINLVPELFDAGASRIILHVESCDLDRTLNNILPLHNSIGFAIKPDTPLILLENYLEYADCLLVFTVNPGWRGQPIRQDAIHRVRQSRAILNANGCDIPLIVDGGVYLDSICSLHESGATEFVVGSAFYGHSNNFQELESNLAKLEAEYRRNASVENICR
jgi:ribulose-phosphate 3-epimerase